MQILTDPEHLRQLTRQARQAGQRIGFVPTMGFLHQGHRSLMDLARLQCDVLIASIYVNPTQFAPQDDLSRYPRDLQGDAATCAAAGVDVLFCPHNMYPPGFCSEVRVSGITARWEGERRPGHFEGVATIVARFFGLVQPHLAVFGEKDYQQLAVIRAMVRDLAMDIEIVGGPLIRDDDGLALSSRNVYLSPQQRQRALSLHQALHLMARHPSPMVAERIAVGMAAMDADAIDYLCIVDPESLEPLHTLSQPARALVVGRYGTTRLLDNMLILP
jgi:pantoate--beta-alanine ligase